MTPELVMSHIIVFLLGGATALVALAVMCACRSASDWDDRREQNFEQPTKPEPLGLDTRKTGAGK